MASLDAVTVDVDVELRVNGAHTPLRKLKALGKIAKWLGVRLEGDVGAVSKPRTR